MEYGKGRSKRQEIADSISELINKSDAKSENIDYNTSKSMNNLENKDVDKSTKYDSGKLPKVTFKSKYSDTPSLESVYKPNSSEFNLSLGSGTFFVVGDKKFAYKFIEYASSDGSLLQCVDTLGEGCIVKNDKSLKAITPLQYREIQKKIAEELKKAFVYNREEEEGKSYRDNHYNIPSTRIMADYHLITTGVYNKDVFIVYDRPAGKDAFRKMKKITEPFIYLIPVDWCYMCQYNESFIRSYISKLNLLGLGEITIKNIAPSPEFSNYIIDKVRNGIHNNMFYHISVVSEFPSFAADLLALLGALYEDGINNIPGLFMQLYDQTQAVTEKNRVWKTLLLSLNMINLPIPVMVYSRVSMGNLTFKLLSDFDCEMNDIDSVIERCSEAGTDIRDNLIYCLFPFTIFEKTIANHTKAMNYNTALLNLKKIKS